MKYQKQKGFTLVELAIVLVVIGLILGMAFKGKDLIDSAKVKSLAAQYEKIVAATNIFYEKYGFYPGDGCPATATTVADCTLPKNGRIDDGNNAGEVRAFWTLLANTNILPASERKSVFGQDWDLVGNAGGLLANATWLDLPGDTQADPRLVCMWDRVSDDGVAGTGRIITLGNAPYDKDTDCWSLSGQLNVHSRI